MNQLDPNPFQVTRSHERALVRVLIMSMRREFNAATMVARLADEYTGRSRRALHHVARLLAEGVPLINALEQTPDALDPASVLALRLATETGTFPQRLESLIEGDVVPDRLRGSRRDANEGQLISVVVGFMMAWFIITFMLLFITPTFEKMFEEFGVVLPEPMQWLITLGNWIGVWFAIFPVILFVMTILIKPVFYGGSTWVFGRGIRMPRAGSDLLALLALNLRAGRSLTAGVASLSQYHPIARIRNRLRQVAVAIEQGENEWEAMAHRNLLSRQQSTALRLTDDPLAQAWLLQRASQSTRRWKDGQVDLLVRAFSLLSLGLLAVIVILTSVGVFMALCNLVEGMSYPEGYR